MTLGDSLMVSLLGLVVVSLVLILLSLLIRLQSWVLGCITAYMHKPDAAVSRSAGTTNFISEEEKIAAAEMSQTAEEGWSAGELKLIGVDEKTAAMVMAIVSHESQIPLSELQFKMIKAID